MPNSRENAILQFLKELTGHQMHGFIVALQGETVAQGYWKPYTAQRPHRLYSVSKSVVSLAVGILAQENKLNLDHRIMDYFPEDVQEHTPELLRQVKQPGPGRASASCAGGARRGNIHFPGAEGAALFPHLHSAWGCHPDAG